MTEKTVKIGCTLRGNYKVTLPGGYELTSGTLVEVPESVLSHPGVAAYLAKGRLFVQGAKDEVAPAKETVKEVAKEPEAKASKKGKDAKKEEPKAEEQKADEVAPAEEPAQEEPKAE